MRQQLLNMWILKKTAMLFLLVILEIPDQHVDSDSDSIHIII